MLISVAEQKKSQTDQDLEARSLVPGTSEFGSDCAISHRQNSPPTDPRLSPGNAESGTEQQYQELCPRTRAIGIIGFKEFHDKYKKGIFYPRFIVYRPKCMLLMLALAFVMSYLYSNRKFTRVAIKHKENQNPKNSKVASTS